MFKSPLKLTFIPALTSLGHKLSPNLTDENLTLRYGALHAAFTEARAARQQVKQTRSELEGGDRSQRLVLTDKHRLWEAYACATLRVYAARDPLYTALYEIQDAIRQAREYVAEPPTPGYYDRWCQHKVMLNNLLCAVELYKLGLSEYEAIPEPPKEGYLWDHLATLAAGANEVLDELPALPHRYEKDRELADLLVAANAATLVEDDAHPGEYHVEVGPYQASNIAEAMRRLRGTGWNVRFGRGSQRNTMILSRRKKKSAN